METINDLRKILFNTLADVKEGKTDIEKANTIVSISQAILNSAKLEVDYLRAADKMAGLYPKTGFFIEENKLTKSNGNH